MSLFLKISCSVMIVIVIEFIILRLITLIGDTKFKKIFYWIVLPILMILVGIAFMVVIWGVEV